MFLGAAGLVEEVLEFVDFGVKTVVQSKASLIAVVVLKRAVAARESIIAQGSGTKRIAGKRNPTEKQRSGVAGSSFQKNIVLS